MHCQPGCQKEQSTCMEQVCRLAVMLPRSLRPSRVNLESTMALWGVKHYRSYSLQEK